MAVTLEVCGSISICTSTVSGTAPFLMARAAASFLKMCIRDRRNAKITELRPDFFIAVHHNSVLLNNDANQSSGTECYYFYDSGKALAATDVYKRQPTARAFRPAPPVQIATKAKAQLVLQSKRGAVACRDIAERHAPLPQPPRNGVRLQRGAQPHATELRLSLIHI